MGGATKCRKQTIFILKDARQGYGGEEKGLRQEGWIGEVGRGREEWEKESVRKEGATKKTIIK